MKMYDNNILVAKYYDLQVKYPKYFKAIEQYVNAELTQYAAQLDCQFEDSFDLDVAQAMKAAQAGLESPIPTSANPEKGTRNYMIKYLDSLGFLITIDPSAGSVLKASLNFGNKAKYI